MNRCEMQQEAPDAGSPLHVAGLGFEVFRSTAVFGVRPEPSTVDHLARIEHDRSTATSKIEMVGPARCRVQPERKVTDTGVPAALAEVVPQPIGANLRCPGGQQPAQIRVEGLGPAGITGELSQQMEQTAGPRRSVTHPQIAEIGRTALSGVPDEERWSGV